MINKTFSVGIDAMNRVTTSAGESGRQSLSCSDQALAACQIARHLEKAGDYKLAREALAQFWPETESRSRLEDLDPFTQAEVLLRIGTLTGWLGSAEQAIGGQEQAKNLITRSLEIFAEHGQSHRLAEGRSDLALCYWREGALDEARVTMADALAGMADADNSIKLTALIRSAVIENSARCYNQALRIVTQALPLIDAFEDHLLLGAYHITSANIFANLYEVETKEAHIDRALIEYTAAGFHFEQAHHTRYRGSVENNLGFVYLRLGKFAEAHEHLDRAQRLFIDLNDKACLAQVNDTRARTHLAEGRLDEAERFARAAVKTLERGDEQSLLSEALTTKGIVVARLGKHAAARASLQRAVEVAEVAGDLEGAGRARLSIIEELEQQTSPAELASLYESAAKLLNRSQDSASTKRLVECSRRVIGALEVSDIADDPPQVHEWDGFSLKKQTLEFERALIERALRDSGGAVTRAARLLGLNNHQSLIAVLNGRHKDLRGVRTAIRVRRRTLMSNGKTRSKKDH